MPYSRVSSKAPMANILPSIMESHLASETSQNTEDLFSLAAGLTGNVFISAV